MSDIIRVYRVFATGRPSGNSMSECHSTLVSAVEALLDHQQRGWGSVSLTPIRMLIRVSPRLPKDAQQPLFPLEDAHAGRVS